MNAIMTPLEVQDAAIHRADELLALAALPLYGDVSCALARIISIVESPADTALQADARLGLLSEAVVAARTLYAAPPALADAPQPHELVNQAFNQLPYGGGIGFDAINEHDSKVAAAAKIASNLTRLGVVLRSVADDHDHTRDELAEHIAAITGITAACELVARQRQCRASAREAPTISPTTPNPE